MPSIEPKGGAGCPSGHVRICAGGVWDNPRSYRNPKEREAVTVTTEKDHARLSLNAKAMVRTLPVTLTWHNPSEPRDLLVPLVEHCRSG